MLREKSNDDQAKACEHDDQTLQDQYQMIQSECFVLRKHYQTLFEHHQTLLEGYSTWQRDYTGTAAYRQTLQDYRQSQQEHRRSIQHFRHRLHTHLIFIRNYRSKQNSPIPAGRPLIRKTILLGVGNEQDAAFLKESVQQAGAHRVFLATDSSQVLCLVQNVHIDVLVLDDGLTPLPAIELYHHLHCMKGLEALPAIIISACFSPLPQTEPAHNRLIGLAKPIKVKELMKVIDLLLV